MNIVVVGCGALGQLAIHALLAAGHHVSGWQRHAKPHLTSQLVTADKSYLHAHILSNSLAILTHCQLLLVTTKAQDVKTAVHSVLPFLSADCPIILLHNGLGVAAQLNKIAQPLLLAVTTHAVCKKGYRYVQTAKGHTELGPLNAAAKNQLKLAKALDLALPTVSWHDNILPCALRKFAINCVINPLAVKYHCKNGNLLTHFAQITQLCQEVATVLPDLGLDMTAKQLSLRVIEVIQLTTENTCSMLQDIQARRITEIDFITGCLLQFAEQNGHTLPLNQTLYQQVKNIEASYVI